MEINTGNMYYSDAEENMYSECKDTISINEDDVSEFTIFENQTNNISYNIDNERTLSKSKNYIYLIYI